MRYWLMKSEPEVFSIDDLKRKKVEPWSGVRNYTARNNLRAMKKGDRVLFYHSRIVPPRIVGEMEVVREAYPDRTSPGDDRWSQVDVKFLRKFPRQVTIEDVKMIRELSGMQLLKFSRLSVMPVTANEYKTILELVGA